MDEREVIDSLIKRIAKLEVELLKKERIISRLQGRKFMDEGLKKEVREKVDRLRSSNKSKRLKTMEKLMG